jgi:hypothetical protein
MGHHDGAHGRVFRGMRAAGRLPDTKQSEDHANNVHHLAHRQVSPSHNTNGDKPVMHIPDGFSAQKAQADDTSDNSNDDSGVETVYEQVFKTLEQTFDGPPQFFTTMEPTTTSSAKPAAETTTAAANSRQGNDDEDQTPSRKPVAQTTATSSASASSSAAPTPSTSSAAQQAVVSSSKPSTTSSSMDITSSSIQTGQVTYTHGAKAADNTSSMIGGTPLSATHSAVAEPQEETGMTGGAKAGLAMGIIFGLALVFGLIFFCWRRKKSQRGLEEFNEKNVPAPAPVNRFSSDSDRLRRTSTQTSATAPRLSLRPVTQFLPNLTSGAAAPKATQNPFGDAAVVSEKGHERTESVVSDSNRSVESATTATSGTAQVVTAAAVPVARGPNNVHRVQLEFKPSMEDELELKSGQLVRMLHEYDDGWVSKPCETYLKQAHTNMIPRHSAQKWTAARRVSSHAHVSPRCPSSLAARHRKTVPHLPDLMAWLHRHLSSTAPWLLAHSLPTSQPNRAAHALPLLKVSRHASPCQARLFRRRATFKPSLTIFTYTQAKHGSPLSFLLAAAFYSLRRERKTSRDRALVPHYFLFYYPRRVLLASVAR